MRGTEDLLEEQKPRARKMRGRAQPYRRNRGRAQGPTLSAILKGAPFYMPNPMDWRRKMQRRGR